MTRVAVPSTGLDEAVQRLAAGELVAFPTETVYGLGADARSDSAVQKIYIAKGRPSGNPLIVHAATTAEARSYAAAWPACAEKLAEKFWPGPLTLIVQRGRQLSSLVSAGRSTVALRVPAHPIARELLRTFNGPIAAPSANRSGFTSTTTAQHVLAELNGRIPLILDGGECAIGLESTVLDLTADAPTILRPGAITFEMLQPLVPNIRALSQSVATDSSAISPGQHASHYAPRTRAFAFRRAAWGLCGPSPSRFAQAIEANHGRVVLITYDPAITLPPPHEVILLPAAADAYARAIYAALRAADDLNASAILVLAPPSTEGLWAAITDRLQRATQPLPSN